MSTALSHALTGNKNYRVRIIAVIRNTRRDR